MGSKTPDGEYEGPNDSSARTSIADINPPKSATASGLLHGSLDGEGEDGEDEDDNAGASVKLGGEPVNGKKKRRKPNKKKKKAKSPGGQQTAPPRKALADIFQGRPYPQGEIVEYANVNVNENLNRTTAEELRHQAAMEKMDDDFLRDYRKAAETHRQVRQYVQTIAKPGVAMSTLAHEIEEGVRALVGHPGIETGDALKAGQGFPTGLALNNCAAHWTPNPGAKEVILQYDDVLKIDFGVHVNGRIVDSAFTVAANPVYDNLLTAVKAATNAGLREAGIDARIDDISATIQETMESHEVILDNKTYPVKALRGLTGHDILPYRIHGAKQVPFVASKSHPTHQRMEEGDVFAIETFGSIGGRARIRDDPTLGVYGYGRVEGADTAGVRHLASARKLLKTIDANFGSLVFSRRYLEHLGVRNYHLGMKALVEQGVVECYEPLVDVQGSYVAQFEHTVLLKPNAKEIISRGHDY